MQSKNVPLLLLATLLHDVGKYYKYTENLSRFEEAKFQHVKGSLAFIYDLFEGKKVSYQDIGDIDIEKLKYLIAKHHDNVDDIYLKILKECDGCSAQERGDEESEAEYRRKETPIEHPLNIISSDNPQESKKMYFTADRVSGFIDKIRGAYISYDRDVEICKLILKEIDEARSNTIDYYSQNYYNEFLNLSKKTVNAKDFKTFFNNLSLVLFDFLKFIPSDITSDRGRMISLYDHLKIASALVNTKNITDLEYTLINIEIGNIQNFLSMYINYEEAKKQAAKILRGRSLFISLLSKIISIYLQEELNLYIVNELMNTAGNILFIAPKLSNEEKEKIVKELERLFIEELDGNLTVVISMKDIRGDQLTDLEKFSKVVKDIKEIIEEEKSRRFKRSLELFYNKNLDSITSERICRACGKKLSIGEQLTCDFCKFLIDIGTESVKKDFLGFLIEISDRKERANYSLKIGNKYYNIRFIDNQSLRSYININNRCYVVFNIQKLSEILDPRSDLSDILLSRFILIPIYEIPYVPTIESEKLGIRIIMPILSEFEEYAFEYKDIKRISILERVPIKIDNFESEISFNKLSLFYIDLDNLGKILYDYESIIESGYNVMICDNNSQIKLINYKLRDRYSISLWSTLSFFISFFFFSIVNKLAEKYNIYTIFSGGDDLKAMGSPHETLLFLFELSKEFRQYFNNKFSFSGSMILADCGIPILKLVGILESLEKAAKNYSNVLGIGNVKGFMAINSELNCFPYALFDELKNMYIKILNLYISKKLSKTALHRIYRILKNTIGIQVLDNLTQKLRDKERFYIGFSKLRYQIYRNYRSTQHTEKGKAESLKDEIESLIKDMFEKEIKFNLGENTDIKYYYASIYVSIFSYAYLVIREI